MKFLVKCRSFLPQILKILWTKFSEISKILKVHGRKSRKFGNLQYKIYTDFEISGRTIEICGTALKKLRFARVVGEFRKNSKKYCKVNIVYSCDMGVLSISVGMIN